MLIKTFNDLNLAYKKIELVYYFNFERNLLINEFKYSLILEGSWLEFENLDNFIIKTFKVFQVNSILYDKTGYDFDYKEYFFKTKKEMLIIEKQIPKHYTKFPNGELLKSNGYDQFIILDEITKTKN